MDRVRHADGCFAIEANGSIGCLVGQQLTRSSADVADEMAFETLRFGVSVIINGNAMGKKDKNQTARRGTGIDIHLRLEQS